MSRRVRRWALCCCAAMTSCIVQPRDPFVSAERAMARDDLLSALQAYDTVSVAHPRYPDARAAAVEIELRMRRCHELILEALVLRGEWRDDEALEALRRARQQWARQPSIDRWIVATEQRRKLFAAREPVAANADEPVVALPPVAAVSPGPSSAPAATADPAAPPPPAASPQRPSVMPRDVVPTVVPAPDGAVAAPLACEPGHQRPDDAPAALPVVVVGAVPAGELKPVVSAPPPPPPPVRAATKLPPVARVSVGEDPVALGLVSVEGRLGRGEFRQAVDDLVELANRFPNDLRVCQRLVPLLKQRALLSYGDGAVAAAVTDWRRVLELQPDDALVPVLIERALGEAGRD